ncbi:MAG TPA: endolytic transglycosylase MltG [Bacteroidetes bacterium]|nr:endolytic transglycosylase MltG [Bacteroidota bacterium]
MTKKKISRFRKVLIALISVVIISAIGVGYSFYQKIYSPNISANLDKQFLFVPTGCNYQQLINIISQKKIIVHSESFLWVAERMSLSENIHPGKYELQKGMSNYDLVHLLRSGKQTPVKLVLNKFRTKNDFASFVSSKLEIDSSVLLSCLNEESFLSQFGFNKEEVICLFVPNTYEFYWNTNADKFFIRMKKEYDLFWNEKRKQEAQNQKLTPTEVEILASIIEEETNQNDEKQTIASVYLNRLKKGMLLQADPTVKFALNDFTIRRIRETHIEQSKDSPYNTYRKTGLPPGPICTPSSTSIDAVLQPAETDYLYFCASSTKPGYHVFASTLNAHQANAKLYQQWLNKRGIN